MRHLIAVALLCCAGCASMSEDTADAWFGDLRSLFSTHDDSAKVNVPPSPFGSSGNPSSSTTKPVSDTNP